MPLDQAVLEHHSLGIVETPDGPRTRVVARRGAPRHDRQAARGDAPRRAAPAGHRPVRVRDDPRAAPPGRAGATLYVSVGGVTNLAVAVGTTCVFTRVVPYGTESMAGRAGRAARA